MERPRLKVIDLFSGAGGLSYGFESTGCEVVLAIEKDSWAMSTYKTNHRNTNVVEADITEIEDSFFIQYKGKVDVLMGGPPCQGFSIAASNRRNRSDTRNTLYKEFLRAVLHIQPHIVLIENVKEIVNYHLPDRTKILDDIKQFLDEHGYDHDFKILNCRSYGIPQDRKRFFLIAIKKNDNTEPLNLEQLMSNYIQPEVVFNEAISDLPTVQARQYPEEYVLRYTCEPKNAYQKMMRENCSEVTNHIPMQHTDKTVKKFEFILSNSGDVLPEDLLPRVRGDRDLISSAYYGQNHRIINGDKVSPTITASFYSSFIHPSQPRNITVREAARIQTFPDSFTFKGKKTTLSKKLLEKKGIFEDLHLDQFNQVGNAVPPLMAQHLADICKNLLSKGC